ncbi:MAG: hypothetical protein CBB60_001950 [Armatimonadetes bacterium Cent15-Ar3]|nr:MAG: hypothetical protein CBB60_001950 [Armatimonadetes bacterium Cent15-Ar3]
MKVKRKLKILVISNLCPPDYDGGFELSALRNAESLRAQGHEVHLVTSRYRTSYQGERSDRHFVHRIFELSTVKDGWSMASTLLSGDSKLDVSFTSLLQQISIRKANIGSLFAMLRLAGKNEAAMREFLKEQDYDVAYVFGLHLIGTSLVHQLTAKGIPVVYHHGDEWLASYLYGSRGKRWLMRLFSPYRYSRERHIDLQRVVLVSEFLRKRFIELGFPSDSLSVIHRGFELPLTPVTSEDRYSPPIFLVASRLALYKGVHIAIRAAAHLNSVMPDAPWELWVAGGGEPEAVRYFEQMVVRLGLEHRVKFLGKLSREQVVQQMKRATAFISPSVFDEPFGNTNIEAMAAGAPLIAARSGAIEEIIVNTESGLIYNRANHEELAAHMKLVLQEPAVAKRLSIQGMERVKDHFTQGHIISLVEEELYSAAGITEVESLVSPSITLR